ncbi:hypothetical protein PVAP13_7KG207420 [Panicum virgatum]|uniref:Uncharacterized protein n=1 Tax=Panicum virgatum TaxID=38727 RepID=A0A8T0QDA0_PANVG|nr:hypothetical protein PVAP13_7KG207420 [Panicum virgatum]
MASSLLPHLSRRRPPSLPPSWSSAASGRWSSGGPSRLSSPAPAPPHPAPAPPGFGGHGNGASGPVRGYTMVARRGAAPFFNNDGSSSPVVRSLAARTGMGYSFIAGPDAGGSAPPPLPAHTPTRWNATAAANRRPGLIHTWVNVPHGEAARRLPNGVHQEQGSSSTSEEYTPA